MAKLEHPKVPTDIKMVDIDPYLYRDDNIYHNKNYKIFTVCRNPYARVVSYYRYQHYADNGIFKDMSFDDYIEMLDTTPPREYNRHNCTQWDNLHMAKVDELIHLENFEKEIREKILDPIGVDIPIPIRKYGGKYDYHDYYNDWSKEIVERIYKIDLENLKYDY